MIRLNARKCRWCATEPCPYPGDKKFLKQFEQDGQKWLEEKPCWTPIPENIGDLYTEDGQLLPHGRKYLCGY